MTDPDDNARIQQLEAELTQLRAKAEHDAPQASPEDLKRAIGAPSLPKMILIGVIIAVLSLGFFVAIYTALSKGFTSLAHKAASSYATDFPDSEEQSTDPAHTPTSEPQRAPAVPGL